MKKRLCALFLALVMAVPVLSLPARALGDDSRVRITGTGTDIATGYFVQYTFAGHTYRSDEMTQTFNGRIWDMLGESDRRTVMKTFAFAPWARKDQFGSAKSAEMCDWIDGITGWKQAAQVLKQRVEEKWLKDLEPWYGDRDKGKQALLYMTGDAMNLVQNDYNLKLAQPWRQRYAAMDQLYEWGYEAYQCTLNLRYELTQISVKAISGELIQIITDKALVPNITPSGTGGAMTSIATGIFDLVNSLTGITDDLTEMTLGRRASASDAADLVKGLGEIADKNYQIAKTCIDEAYRLRKEIEAAAPDLVPELRKRSETAAQAAQAVYDPYNAWKKDPASPSSGAAASAAAAVPVQPPDPKREDYSSQAAYEAAVEEVSRDFSEKMTACEEELKARQAALLEDLKQLQKEAGEAYLALVSQHAPCPTGEDSFGDEYSFSHSVPSAALDDAAARAYHKKADSYILYQQNRAREFREIGEQVGELLKTYEARASAVIADSLGICKGRDEGMAEKVRFNFGRWYQGNFPYASAYQYLASQQVFTSLASTAASAEEDAENCERKAESMKIRAEQFDRDRAAWLEGIRAKTVLYREAQDNYIDAAQYYADAYSSRAALLDGLPAWVKDQQVQGVSGFYADYLTFTREQNGTLYDMVFGKTGAEREAYCQQLGRQIQPLFREDLRYQRRMKSAEIYMRQASYQLRMNKFYGDADVKEFMIAYGLPGATAFMNYRDILDQDPRQYLTPGEDDAAIEVVRTRNADAVALRMLSNDLNVQGRLHTDMALVCADLQKDRGKILRTRDKALFAGYKKKYTDAAALDPIGNPISQSVLTASVYRFGEDSRLLAPLGALVEDIEACLNSGYVPVGNLLARGDVRPSEDGTAVSAALAAGETCQLEVETNADATRPDLIWSSSDPSVVFADGDGRLTALAEGTAVITVRAADCVETPVYETDEAGETVKNANGDPVLLGYACDPPALTYTVSVSPNAAGTSPLTAPNGEDSDYLWYNCGSPEAPRYAEKTVKGDTVTVTARFRTRTEYNARVFLALYDGDGALLACGTRCADPAETLREISVSCPADSRPVLVRGYVLSSENGGPISAVPFEEAL